MAHNDTQFEASLFKSIDNKIQSSYVLLLMTYCQLSLEDTPLCYKDVMAVLSEDVPQLKDILSTPFDQREEKSEKYLSLRHLCLAIGKELLLYQFHIEFLTTCRNFVIQNRLSEATEIPHFHTEDFVILCERYIDSAQDRNERAHIQDLMACIPIKMTREKYFDYYQKGIASAIPDFLASSIGATVTALENRCIPMASPYYGITFPNWKSKLEEISFSISLQPEVNEYNGHDPVIKQLDKLADEINMIWSFLELFHETILYMLIILFYASDIDYIWGGNLIYKDLYHTVTENNDNSGKEALFPQVIQAAEELLEELINTDRNLTDKIEKKLHTKSAADTQSEELITIYTTINNVFLENLFQSAESFDFPKDNSTLTQKEVDDAIRKSVDSVAEVISHLSSDEQKIFRQVSMGIIPSPYTRDGFFAYLSYFLNGASEKQLAQFIHRCGYLFHQQEHSSEYISSNVGYD